MGESLYEAIGHVSMPRMVRIRQRFEDNRIEDIESRVREELAKPGVLSSVKPGMSVALTASSRPIANLPLSLRTNSI